MRLKLKFSRVRFSVFVIECVVAPGSCAVRLINDFIIMFVFYKFTYDLVNIFRYVFGERGKKKRQREDKSTISFIQV